MERPWLSILPSVDMYEYKTRFERSLIVLVQSITLLEACLSVLPLFGHVSVLGVGLTFWSESP